MHIRVDPGALKDTTWQQCATRFVLGGLVTAAAGMVAKAYGPVIGGLFLCFPAIFPAGATLVEKHEKQKKAEKGLHGELRARWAVSVDAAGASLGSIGLFVFGLLVWQFAQGHPAWLVLSGATVTWLVVSISLWYLRKRLSLLKRFVGRLTHGYR
jgi:hypothetical protein